MCEGPLRRSWTGPHKLDLNPVQHPSRDLNTSQQRLMEPEQICRGQKELDAVIMATRQLFLGRTRELEQTCVRDRGPGWDVTGSPG